MNIKKYLQQLADKEEEQQLTESELQYIAELAQDVQEKPVTVKRSKGFWAAIGSAVTAVLLAVIIIPVCLTVKPGDEVYYNEENIVNRESTIEELNSSLNSFKVEQSEATELKIQYFYDSVSNNGLYYEVNVTGLVSECKLIIVVNERYNYNFTLNGDVLTKQLNDLVIEYFSIDSDDTLNNTGAQYKGKIQLNKEIAYIDYTQIIDLGEQAFFDDIQSVLKIKN